MVLTVLDCSNHSLISCWVGITEYFNGISVSSLFLNFNFPPCLDALNHKKGDLAGMMPASLPDVHF